jgi:hypothetical protein
MTAVNTDQSTPYKDISWKTIAASVALILSIYRLFTSATFGDSISGFIIALVLLLSEGTKLLPKDMIYYLRAFFKYGDRYSRYILVIVAIGGTALCVKEVFGLSLLPEWLKLLG